jgi:hypothetical protein
MFQVGESGSKRSPNNIVDDDRSSPGLHLPKTGEAIRGMGEKFAANPVTGTGVMSTPIAVSPDRSGFDPKITPSYDSASGRGPHA